MCFSVLCTKVLNWGNGRWSELIGIKLLNIIWSKLLRRYCSHRYMISLLCVRYDDEYHMFCDMTIALNRYCEASICYHCLKYREIILRHEQVIVVKDWSCIATYQRFRTLDTFYVSQLWHSFHLHCQSN